MDAVMERIISVANELQVQGYTSGSMSEHIAGALVLNRVDYLPELYSDVTEAWERLGDWQRYVIAIKRDYRHLIEGQ